MSIVLRHIDGQFPRRLKESRAVVLHRAVHPFVHGSGAFSFINAETRINIWNGLSFGNGQDVLAGVVDGALKELLLPYYHGDEGIYSVRVQVRHSSYGIDRLFRRLASHLDGHWNTVNIMFFDAESDHTIPYNAPDTGDSTLDYTYWHQAYEDGHPAFRTQAFEADISNLRQTLSTPSGSPDMLRAKVFHVQDSGYPGHPQSGSYVLERFIKSVEHGLGDYDAPWGLSDRITSPPGAARQIQFQYAVDNQMPQGHYAGLIYEYLKSLRIRIADLSAAPATGQANKVFISDFSHPDEGSALDEWSVLWGFDAWSIQSGQGANEGDSVLRCDRSVTGNMALSLDSVGELSDGEIRSLFKAGGNGGHQNEIIARASAAESANNAYFARLADSGNYFDVVKLINSSETIIGRVPFSWNADSWYWIAFRFVGGELHGKVWPFASQQPGWMISVKDDDLSQGKVGVGRSANGWQLWDVFRVGVLEEKPEPALNFGAVTDETSVSFSWDPAPDVDGYNLYLNGVRHNSDLIPDPGYVIEGISAGVYQASLRSVKGLLEGEPAEAIEFSIITGVDAPENFSVELIEDFSEPPQSFDVDLMDPASLVPENFAVNQVVPDTLIPKSFTVEAIDDFTQSPENFTVELVDEATDEPPEGYAFATHDGQQLTNDGQLILVPLPQEEDDPEPPEGFAFSTYQDQTLTHNGQEILVPITQ